MIRTRGCVSLPSNTPSTQLTDCVTRSKESQSSSYPAMQAATSKCDHSLRKLQSTIMMFYSTMTKLELLGSARLTSSLSTLTKISLLSMDRLFSTKLNTSMKPSPTSYLSITILTDLYAILASQILLLSWSLDILWAALSLGPC